MANKIKKISISSLDKAIKEHDAENGPEAVVSWNGIDVTVKRRLSLYEMMKFVQTVVDNCVRKTDGKYLPEVFDFIINNNIIEFYTNITLPEKAEHRYDILCRCRPLYKLIIEEIDKDQYHEIIDAIRSRIDYETKTNIDAVMKKVEDAQAMIESIGSVLSSMVDGIDPDTFKSVMEKIADGDKIDEGKIMEAYLNNIGRDVDGEH